VRLFKRKPKYKRITSVSQVKAHLREFLMDSQIPNPDEISLILGCSPISDELMEKYEEESEVRVERVSYLIPLLYGYSALFAEAFVSTIEISALEDVPAETKKLLETITSHTQKVLEESMSHLLVGSVSQMVDLGLLNLPKGK
jgi:hypothetical protein